MSTDPRNVLKNVLQNVTATIDDGVTPADILVMYEGGPENLKHLFHVNDYDVVITVGRWDERRAPYPKLILNNPLRYERYVPASASAIDKTGVTATKVLNKVRDSIELRVESFGVGGGAGYTFTYAWFMETNTGSPQYLGGIENVWIDDYRFFWRRADDI